MKHSFFYLPGFRWHDVHFSTCRSFLKTFMYFPSSDVSPSDILLTSVNILSSTTKKIYWRNVFL